MSEVSPEIKRTVITKERVTNVFALAKDIKPLINNRSDTAAQQTKDFLEKICPGAGYTEFGQVLDGSHNGNLGEQKQTELGQVAEITGAALLIAGGDNIFDWASNGELDSHMSQGMSRLSEVVNKNLFMEDENDEVGKKIVTQLGALEKANRRAAMAPNSYEETRERETKKTIDVLLDKYDNVDPDSEDAEKIGAVVGCLDEGLKKVESRQNGSKKAEIGQKGENKEGVSPLVQQQPLDSGSKKTNAGSELGSSNAISAQELYRHPLTDFSPEGIRKWGADLVLRLGNDSLFFNQGWTQLASFIDAQTYEAMAKTRLSGGDKEKVERACRFVESAVTVRAHEAALYSSDAVLSLYLEKLPPPDRMVDERYLWVKGSVNALLGKEGEEGKEVEVEPSVLADVHKNLLERAYSTKDGGNEIRKFIKGLKGGLNKMGGLDEMGGLDKMADDYVDKINSKGNLLEKYKALGLDSEDIKNQARLAVSLFIVDNYVPWASWIYSNVDKPVPVWEWKDGKWKTNGTSTFNWIHKSEQSGLLQRKRSRMSDDRFEGQKTEMVEMWPTNLRVKTEKRDENDEIIKDDKGKIKWEVIETGLENPLMTLVRPVDVLRVKNDFAEDIIRPLHDAFWMLSSEVWMIRKDGRNKDTHVVENVKSFPNTSKLNFKQIGRWSKAWDNMVGGSHGDSLDSMEKAIEGAKKICNMFSTYDMWSRENVAGAVVGDIMAVKVKAALSRGDETFVKNMLRTAARLGDYSKEQSTMAAQIYGSDMSQDFGIIRQALSNLNLNIDTKNFLAARKMIVTSSTNEKYLDTQVALKKGLIILDGLFGVGKKKR